MTTSSELVSVVMATYINDPLPFLQRAVESILNQDYQNLEFIIVLDGEIRQDTLNYLESIDDERIRLLKLEKNGGPAKARNRGIDIAAGEFIAIMDADDISVPERISKQLQIIKKEEVDVLGSFYEEINEEGIVTGSKEMPVTSKEILRLAPFFNPVNNPTVMVRSSVLKKVKYHEGLRLGEDYRLWLQLLRQKYRLLNTDRYLLKFRKGEDFYENRRGFGWAFSDLKNRLYALPLAKPWVYPFGVFFAVAIFFIKLMPAGILSPLYKLKKNLM